MNACCTHTHVRSRTALPNAAVSCAAHPKPISVGNAYLPPRERFFSKTQRCRKNGIACVSERRRIPCPKTSRLQQEADAAERNQASLRLTLQELPSWFQVKEYLATFQDARRMLAVRYRHTSNTVLGRVVHSIHEEGQKRHTKVNGEGSLNACGSEGSPSHGACSSSDPVERIDEAGAGAGSSTPKC